MFYVGIGYASKLSSNDYTQVAKKNALQDMLGEIKVTVSTNSLLSQYQNNKAFSQQFLNDIKIVSEGTLEGFEIADAYENETDYWIYYRLNKADYERAQRKKIDAAIEKSLAYLNEADMLETDREYSRIFKLRVKALAALQQYANNNLETVYKGKQVFLLNEIVSLIQKQLYLLKLKSGTEKISITAGRPLEKPITINVSLVGSNKNIAFVPVAVKNNQGGIGGTKIAETNSNGAADFFISSITGNQPVHMVTFYVDVNAYFKADTFNAAMHRLIETFDVPEARVQFLVEPIKVFLESQEYNLDKPLDFKIIEPVLKKRLMESGCNFVKTSADAQYILQIKSNTKDEGNIWGKMLQSSIETSILLIDNKINAEIFKESVKDIKGFQLNSEKAGLDAYNNVVTEINKNVFPRLQKVILNL